MLINLATMEICFEIPKKLKIELPNNPCLCLLGLYLKESKSAYHRDTCTHMFIIMLLATTELWDQSRGISMDG
jgi:hypothetical protein